MSTYYLDRPDFAPMILNYPQRPIYSGESIALEARTDQYTLVAGESVDLLTVYGIGRLSHLVVYIANYLSLSEINALVIELLVDGAKKLSLSPWYVELYSGLQLYYKMQKLSSTDWVYPDNLTPYISPIGVHYDPANYKILDYFFYVHGDIEFTDNVVVRVINNTTHNVSVQLFSIVGYYP